MNNIVEKRRRINEGIRRVKNAGFISITEMKKGELIGGYELFYPRTSTRSGEVRTMKEFNKAREEKGLKPVTETVYNALLNDVLNESRTTLTGEYQFQKSKLEKLLDKVVEKGIIDKKPRITKDLINKANSILQEYGIGSKDDNYKYLQEFTDLLLQE